MVRPRLRLAIADHALCTTASLSRWTHLVGVTGGMFGADTPTRNAIELSSPVVRVDRVNTGELNSWHSNLPPPGGGNATGACFNQDASCQLSRGGRITQIGAGRRSPPVDTIILPHQCARPSVAFSATTK